MVCMSATTASTTKTAELIEVPFGEWIRVGLGNHVLNGGSDLPTEWGTFGGRSCARPDLPAVDILDLNR